MSTSHGISPLFDSGLPGDAPSGAASLGRRNIFLNSAPATVAAFDHLTSYRGLAVGCGEPGAGVQITNGGGSADAWSFTNAIVRGNAPGRDFETCCDVGCDAVTVSVMYSDVGAAYLDAGIAIPRIGKAASSSQPRSLQRKRTTRAAARRSA